MAARSCARRAHQLAASIIANGVGPSRLSAASSCPSTRSIRLAATSRSFSVSAARLESEVEAKVEAEVEVEATTIIPPVQEPQRSSRARKNTGLIEDVSDAAPTLEYLDSLKPRLKPHRKDQPRKRDNINPFAKAYPKANVEDKQWERTQSRIQDSFTRDQLVALARAAKIPGAYNTKVRKDDIVRRIMIHRFGMEDSKERADRERREELEKRSVHIPFLPAELFLLLARGSAKVRQEAGKAQVVILPKPPKKEADAAHGKLGVWVRGKDQGIQRMVEWVDGFKQSIKTKQEQVVLSAEPPDATATEGATAEVLPAELLRFISQLSGCFMKASPVQNGKLTLSLAYTDERDAQKAVLLLRQYQSHSVAAMQRIGAAAYCDNLDTLRQYSMLPFVPNEPVPWTKQVDDLVYGAPSDVSFRVSHVPDINAFMHLSNTKLPAMKLTRWTDTGETAFSEPLQALVKASSPAATPPEEVEEVECSATLGHVLFSSDGLTLADEGLSEEQVVARMQDPLAAPRPGTWPVEHVTEWARGFRSRFGREASRFVPATLFRSQKNISLDIWLDRQGYVLVGKGTADSSVQKMVFTYQQPAAASSKLEIVLARRQTEAEVAEAADGGWTIESTRWVTRAEADLMIPERSADLRLSAKTAVALDAQARSAVEEALAPFADGGASPKVAANPAQVVDDVAEADVEVDADEMLGGETEVVERAETETAEPPATPSAGPGVKGLPPSTLTLPSIGDLALESATRLTSQTYQHRSSFTETKSEPTVAAAITEAEVASEEATKVTMETSSAVEASDTTEADAEANVGPSANAADIGTAPVAEVEPSARDDSTS